MHEPDSLGHVWSEEAGNDTGVRVVEGNALALPVADRAGGKLDREMEACFCGFLAPAGTVLWNREAMMIAGVHHPTAPASTSTRRSIR